MKKKRSVEQDETTFLPGEVAGYIRDSSEEQAESGFGREAQIAKVRAQAIVKSWPEPVFYIDDGVSGTTDPRKRKQLARLLDDIAAGKVKAVICSALDRLGRKALIILNLMEEFKEYDINFISCKESLDTSTPYGQFALILFAAVAELERNLISQRTQDALAQKSRQDGDAGGRVPYGYKRIFDLVKTVKGEERKTIAIEIDPIPATIVRMIFDLRAQRRSLAAIARAASKISTHGPRGGNWHASTIAEILRNKNAYLGGTRGESSLRWPRLLDEELAA